MKQNAKKQQLRVGVFLIKDVLIDYLKPLTDARSVHLDSISLNGLIYDKTKAKTWEFNVDEDVIALIVLDVLKILKIVALNTHVRVEEGGDDFLDFYISIKFNNDKTDL